MDEEEGRACVYELDPATGATRIFASGLRNPVGLAWEPTTGALWTVVNERDGLGDETPPDYLTSLKDGGFYGWPLLLLGPDGRRPRAAGSGPGRDRADRRTTRWAATPRRWGCAGCRTGRCRGSAPAWRSASTARGTAAR